MDREDLSVLDWLRHAQEEAMDLSLYLEKLIVIEESKRWHPWDLSTMLTEREFDRQDSWLILSSCVRQEALRLHMTTKLKSGGFL